MQRISVLLLLLVACSFTAMLAQAPAPAMKPDPALKKLSVLLGHWTYEGEGMTGPSAPRGKFTGEESYEMILGGFFLQNWNTTKGPTGETRSLLICGYDPVNKNFTLSEYGDDGATFSGVFTFSGNTLTYRGKGVAEGKQFLGRGTYAFAADLMSYTFKEEVSDDGKTWTPVVESKSTKVKPAPKK